MDISTSAGNDLLDVPNGDPASYCRLCLSCINVEELFPDGQGPRQDVIQRITECTGIRITLEDDYPSAVCWMCSISLQEFQWFRERCHRYDVLIRRKRKKGGLSGRTLQQQQQLHSGGNNRRNYGGVVVEDTYDDYEGEMDPEDPDEPVLKISSVQAGFGGGRYAAQASNQPEEKDVKPNQQALAAFAERYSAAGAGSSADAPPAEFQCKICSRSFKTKTNLWEHNRLHTGQLPFQCSDCGTSFGRVKSLMAHKQKYHSKDSTEDPPLRLQCQFCPRVFPRHADRKQHAKKFHPTLYDPNESSDTPTPTTLPPSERSTPMMSTPKPVVVKLPFDSIGAPGARPVSQLKRRAIPSSTSTPSISSQQKQKQRTSTATATSSNHPCGICLESFKTALLREEHINQEHPKGAILACPFCTKTFKSRQTIRMHILNHQGKLPFECDDCGSRFDRRFYLQKHRARYHNGAAGSQQVRCRYKCKFCPRLFLEKKDRITHSRLVHGKEIKIKTEKVDPEYDDSGAEINGNPSSSNIGAVANKKLTPMATPPVQTPTPTFTQATELSFGCLQCGRQFPSADLLGRHTAKHHPKQDIKPVITTVPKIQLETPVGRRVIGGRYKCPYCPKTFSRGYVMKEHTFIHTGTLKHQCDECLVMFNRPQILEKHKLKYHSPNSKFVAVSTKCRFCPRWFIGNRPCRRHEQIAHGASMNDDELAEASHNGRNENGDDDDMDDDFDDGVEVDGLDDYVGGEEGGFDDGEGQDEDDFDYPTIQPEIRDVVITLERIPDAVLQTLDTSYEDYDYDYEDANESESAPTTENHQPPDPPRMNLALTLHRCHKCLKLFKTRKSLKHHMIYHQQQLPFTCDECGVQFARNAPLKAHKERYHSEDAPYTGVRFSCDYCPRIFLRGRDKLFHQKTVHLTERTYRRDEGTPEIKKPKIKKRKDYVCLNCCDRFETEKSCQRHINENHPEEVPAKTSPATPSMLLTPKLEVVMGTADEELPPNSAIPPASPPPAAPAAASLGVALTGKPYKLCRCSLCTSLFKNRDNWSDHIQNHANIRPHHCEPCLIKRKSRHNRKAVTSVGFKCQHCPKVFAKANTLRTHQRLHNSELRFPCDECGMMYDRYRLLQAHKEKYHSEESALQPPLETFRCTYCPRTFMRFRDLKHHQESVHAV